MLTVTPAAGAIAVTALTFDTPESVFMRRVTVGVREFDGTEARERILGGGTIYRVALDGAPARSRVDLTLDQSVPAAELLVHIHNGDSPPLEVTAVRVRRPLLSLVFVAPAPGTYTLLSGNSQAQAPRYDLASLAGDLRGARAGQLIPGPRENTPDYRPRDPLTAPTLAEVPLAGAPLDVSAWIRTKPVRVARPGVQELELDPQVLSGSRRDLTDLRLMRAGNQVPYLLERPNLARPLALEAVSAPDAARPTLSRWQIALPSRRLPLQRLVLASPTSLFEREFRLYEKVPGGDGRVNERVLASGTWRRTPDAGSPGTFALELRERPAGSELFLETDNGDNPALALEKVTGTYPVTRLVFKTAEEKGYTLAYGRAAAPAPRYDLGLVAPALLAADRIAADLGEETAQQPGAFSGLLRGTKGGVIFWSALALVVASLLFVVAKLLPKKPQG